MEDINEYTRNLYIIRRRLSDLTKPAGSSCFYYYVGNFIVKIHTDRIQEHANRGPEDRITFHNILDVHLYEYKRHTDGNKYEEYVDLEKDSRFKSYQPIKYSEWSGYSTGREMPINHLCELVKYLHRLSNLAVFM
jgi:hypothetical protein